MTGSDPHQIAARDLLAAFEKDVIDHAPGTRWAHTHGLGVVGHFVASDVARQYCAAEHFRGQRVPVTVRFSNASSEAQRHDEWQDIRGMATKFHLGNGGDGGDGSGSEGVDVDLIAVSLDVFIARTRAEFLGVAKADRPRPVTREHWWQRLIDRLRLELPLVDPPPGQVASGVAGLLAYAGTHRDAQAGVAGAGVQAVPMSWARVKYHAVHTFVVVDPDGVRRHVRFAWQPVAGVCPLDHPLTAAPDFLSTEMRQRLQVAPARFELKMTIGDDGDAFEDPTKAWPVTRRVVMMGSLYLDRVAEDQELQCERLSYNPMRLIAGIEASDDEILRARGEVYVLAAGERGAIGCPMGLAAGMKVS
ncbi:MAG TPA: catalase [Ilumatobacteraceae bacterium]|nr:catalase [Ilumatobacteraceae bacterium]